MVKTAVAKTCENCGGSLCQGARGYYLPCSCGWVANQSHDQPAISKLFLVCMVIGSVGLVCLFANFRLLFPDNGAADEHMTKAKDFVYNNENEAAIKEMKSAIALAPIRSDLHHELALAFFRNSQPHQGLEEAEQAARLAPNDYKVQEVFAELLVSYGAEAKALEQFELVVNRFPNESVCRQQAALAFESAGKDEKAISLWKAALKLDPEVPSGWARLAKLVYRNAGSAVAESIINSGIKHNPESPKLHFWHGLIMSEQNRPDIAAKSFANAAKLDPDYSELVAPYLDDFANSHGKNLSIIPCQQGQGGQYVTATLNDETRAKLLIDSGATVCVINRRLAHKLGLDLLNSPRTKFESVTGIDDGIEIVLDSLKVGGFAARNVKCIVYDGADREADGILGMSFLSRFKFTVDTDVRQLILVKK